jgi:DNA modification methylase
MEYKGIINGDSDIILDKLISDGLKFDIILTDPPYNLKKDFGNDSDNLDLAEFLILSKKRIQKCSELLKPNGSIIWFATHHYVGYIQVIMYEAGLNYRRLNIWHYTNGFSRQLNAPLTQYEPFLWFSKSNKIWTYNRDEVRIAYRSLERLKTPVFYKDSKGFRKPWTPNPLGALRGDVWSFPTLAGKSFEKERTKHPSQKPETLITEIIKALCPKNEEGKYEGSILDPFHGSGTLGVCCEKLNLKGNKIHWLGIELEKKWCEIANARLDNLEKYNDVSI